MSEIKIILSLKCAFCGDGLVDIYERTDTGHLTVGVEPCERCMELARDEGYEEAKKEDEHGRT